MDRQIKEMSKKRTWKRIFKRGVSLLCAVVMLFTMNTLKRNADTLERIAMCGYAEHVHSESCFVGDVLSCGMTEHIHTDACYQQTPVKPGEEAVAVTFICDPADAAVTVYPAAAGDGADEAPAAIEAGEDGTWLLLPGEYTYSAAAEGYVPAEGGLYQDMTPRAGMKFVADALGMGSREATEKIDAAVRKFGIKDVSDTPVKNLSAGACKLAALAQASFAGAEVIIIDEPTQGLNSREILEMREAIRSLRADHAVLLTSKNITELCEVADRVMVLHAGRILAEGTPDQLHLMTAKDGTLRLVVRCGEEEAKKAFGGIGKQMEVKAAAEEGAVEVVLSTDGADLRSAAFKAVCTAGMELLYFGLVEKTLDELLMSMDSERIIYAPEKEDSGDEGNL